jgi:flagellar hook assembly protein FlgD
LPRWLAPAVFAALIVVTAGAFVQAQLVKKDDLILDRVRATPRDFSPNGDGRRDVAYFRFRLTRPDTADVLVVDEAGKVVRTLARNRPLGTYRYLVFSWDGRTDAGELAPPGAYRPRVILHRQDRDLLLGKELHLRHPPPVVEIEATP